MKLKRNINTNKMLNGDYYKVIKNYFDIFGKDNVYICLFEDFIKGLKFKYFNKDIEKIHSLYKNHKVFFKTK